MQTKGYNSTSRPIFNPAPRVTPISGRVFPVRENHRIRRGYETLQSEKERERENEGERRAARTHGRRVGGHRNVGICTGKYAWTRPSQLHECLASIMRRAFHCDLCRALSVCPASRNRLPSSLLRVGNSRNTGGTNIFYPRSYARYFARVKRRRSISGNSSIYDRGIELQSLLDADSSFLDF